MSEVGSASDTVFAGMAIDVLAAEITGSARKSIVHILPAGKFQPRDGRGPWKNSNPQALIKRTREYHGTANMVIDYDHQTMFSATAGVGGTAPAAGWITALEARKDGIWAHVEWTEAAASALAKREYRYLSPVIPTLKNGEVWIIQSVGLTNTPALNLTAVASTEKPNMDTSNMDEQLAALRALLGLDSGATIEDIADRVKIILGEAANSATPDPAKYVPIGDFQRVIAEGNKLRRGITRTAAEAHVGAQISAGRLLPFLRDWAVELCTSNKPAFDDFMDGLGPAVSHIIEPQLGAITRRVGAESKLSATELAVCSQMGLTEEQFIKAQPGVIAKSEK